MAEAERQELTLQDLGGLPARALVGFAARCARRVLPILRRAPEIPEKILSLKIAEAALQLAEDFARDRIVWLDQFGSLGQEAYAAARDSLGEGQYAVHAAGHAATAAAWAHKLLGSQRTADAMELVAATWGAYRVLLSFVRGPIRRDVAGAELVFGAVRAEYDRLVCLSPGRPGAVGAPLDPTERGPLGPLWPDGPPVWAE